LRTQFDLDQSRRYWRHAPAGADKLDTDALATAGDASVDVWDAAFRSRLLTYSEEEQFIRTLAERVNGRRIVSIGSGLGFHELFYAAAGAHVTCCDIVPTNLSAIERVAARRHIPIATFSQPDLTAQPLPGPADIVFVYGCLMHMPADAQRALFDRARDVLAPGGSIVLMVYAWELARRTCGWTDPAQFDPVAFARASDPTVGDEACPWSDWHDDGKLLQLAGSGARVARRQLWNDGQFAWYELSWTATDGAPRRFFDERTLGDGELLLRVRARDFSPEAAEISRGWRSVTVRASASRSSYVLVSPPIDRPSDANAVVVDLSIEHGALSIGILDVAAQRFVSVAVRSTVGRHTVLLLAAPLPEQFQIVISNHQPSAPARGRFVLHGARVLTRPIATLADRNPQSAFRNPQS
jgi:SAM-dependent methyltransferase